MAQEIADRRDIDFVIWEQMKAEEILANEKYSDFNKKTCEMIITEARKLAIKEALPTLAEGDKEGIHYEDGKVKVPGCFHKAHKLILEGEWQNLPVSAEMGGQDAPPIVATAATEYFMGANWPLFSYAAMGNGTAEMIQLYGTEAQKSKYVKRLTSGEWGGTMLLTESEAGSDVGALTTIAKKNGDGTYTLTGNKIFITNGEHDLVDNIIHPVLARVEGAPIGTKGISLFIVPKYFVNDDGSLGDRNDIVCSGVEEKHGIHASATCSMAIGAKGECVGYLLGEENKGMKIMFHMMNGARMATGLQALSYASSAYMLAVNYARERLQGRDLSDFGNAEAPSVPIIKHPDVRRNLMWMKSYLDGMRSFFYYMTICGTKAEIGETEEEKETANDMFELLTPLIKDFLSVKGHEICVQAMQVYGGAGYTMDYPVEQYVRDCKITSIFEGTSGIQAMDLLGRKLGMKKGAVFMAFMGEIQKTVAQAKEAEATKELAEKVEKAVNRLGEIAMHMGKKALSLEFKTAFAHSLPFLYAMSDTVMAWMLLWRATTAVSKIEKASKKDSAFYEGQLKTADFFINSILPETMGKMNGIETATSAAIDMPDDGFGGL